MHTILKKLTAGLFTVAILLISSATVNAAIVLSLEPSSSQIDRGSSFTVNLVVSGLGDHTAPSLSAFDVDVSYDASLFSLGAVSFGSALGNVSLGEAWSAADSSISGTVNLSAFSLLEVNSGSCTFCTGPYLEDLQGSTLTLASLSFTAVSAGTRSFGLAVNSFGDGFGDPLTVGLAAAPTVSSVPTPANLWLFGVGLVGLGMSRSRSAKLLTDMNGKSPRTLFFPCD